MNYRPESEYLLIPTKVHSRSIPKKLNSMIANALSVPVFTIQGGHMTTGHGTGVHRPIHPLPPGQDKGWTMEEIKNDPLKVERAILIGVREPGMSSEEAGDHLDELASLVDTMGVGISDRLLVSVSRPHPHLYVGQGKAQEILEHVEELDADVLIFDHDLTPSQQRNWEKFSGICVIDRQEVILDIFADRAQTREAVIQVALARSKYSLPRLRRAWTHLERQRGGHGQRGGMGEMQLEIDQRIVHNKIARLKKELKLVRRRRQTQRKSRENRPVPVAAIVGYTNVGKSSLLRRLTDADVLVEDKLFATLDTTTRKIILPNNQPLLLTDTVGFVRRLPHDLVEAFKATLEEAAQADYLIQVLDISHPKAIEQYKVTNQVLEDLGAGHSRMMLLLNKMDKPHDPGLRAWFRNEEPMCQAISTLTGEGIDATLEIMAREFVLPMTRNTLHIPHDRFDLVDLMHREGIIHAEHHDQTGGWYEVTYPIRFHGNLEEYITDEIPDIRS
jgi:GTP-binding protein HflX